MHRILLFRGEASNAITGADGFIHGHASIIHSLIEAIIARSTSCKARTLLFGLRHYCPRCYALVVCHQLGAAVTLQHLTPFDSAGHWRKRAASRVTWWKL